MPWLKRILGNLVCQLSRVLQPRQIKRDKVSQAQVDRDAGTMSFYDASASIECCSVRRLIHRLNVAIQIRDAGRYYHYRVEVLEGGQGRLPCLRIDTPRESSEWIYGRKEIRRYLQARFNPSCAPISQIVTE